MSDLRLKSPWFRNGFNAGFCFPTRPRLLTSKQLWFRVLLYDIVRSVKSSRTGPSKPRRLTGTLLPAALEPLPNSLSFGYCLLLIFVYSLYQIVALGISLMTDGMTINQIFILTGTLNLVRDYTHYQCEAAGYFHFPFLVSQYQRK
jgi:hypothetical protein